MSSLFGGNKEKEQNKQVHDQASVEAAQAALQMGLGDGGQRSSNAAVTQQGLLHGGMQHVGPSGASGASSGMMQQAVSSAMSGMPHSSAPAMSGMQMPGSAMGTVLGGQQQTYCPPGQQCPPATQCTHMPQQQYHQPMQMAAPMAPGMHTAAPMAATGMMHMDAKEQEKHLKEQEKMMQKEQKEHEKEMKEAKKQHEKEVKAHEKEIAREQKEREKEIAREQKEADKQLKEAEKQREKEEKEREKEMKEREERERKTNPDLSGWQAGNRAQPHSDAFNPLVGVPAGQSAAAAPSAPMAGTSKPSTAQGTSHFSLLPSGTLNTTGH